MSALSDLLNRAIADKFPESSNRDLAKRAGVSRGTVDNYRNGVVVKPTEEVLQAFHALLGIPIQGLRDAAGLPRGEAEPYTAPAEANLLDDRQRNALDELIRSIVATRGQGYGLEATPEPRASGEAVESQKTEEIDGSHSPPPRDASFDDAQVNAAARRAAARLRAEVVEQDRKSK